MIDVLRKSGNWTQHEAMQAARKGDDVLVRDDGDDEFIGIDDIG